MDVDLCERFSTQMEMSWRHFFVKNGFSTRLKSEKVKIRQGKDITNDHQGKASEKGCHERE